MLLQIIHYRYYQSFPIMKYIAIFLLLLVAILIGFWKKIYSKPKTADELRWEFNTGVKWNDSLLRFLPSNLDTTIVVLDNKQNPLKFKQYIQAVFDNQAIIYRDRAVWRLHRLTIGSNDSLSKDGWAIATTQRKKAFLTRDTVKNWKIKLDKLAEQFNQADYLIAKKSSRKLYLYRQQKVIRTFDINLGYSPIGNKVTEGDGKTPEGIYYLYNKYDRNDHFYRSINISYPSLEDQAKAEKKGIRPGYGILIHGTRPDKVKAKDWTAGCIALQNKDMDTLFKYVGEGTTIDIRN